MTRRSGYTLVVVVALLAGGLALSLWWSGPDVDVLLEEATAARGRGEHALAVELYTQAAAESLAVQPAQAAKAAHAHSQAALLLLQSFARLDESEHHFRHALSSQPGHFEAGRGLAMLLAVSGRRWEAVPVIRRALRSRSQEVSDGSEIDLLRLMDVGGGMRLDLSVLDEALSQNREDPVALLGLASGDLDAGRLQQVVERARAALGSRSDLVAARSVIGRGLLATGRIAELVQWHQRLPESANGDPRVWVVRGEFHDRAGHDRAAARCYWEVLKLQPDQRTANYRLGELLRDLDRETDAEIFSRRAADLQTLREIDDRMIAEGGVGSLELIRQKVEHLEGMGRMWEAWGWARLAAGRDEKAEWPGLAVERIEWQLEIETIESPGSLTQTSSNPALALDLSEWSQPDWSVVSIATATDADSVQGTTASFRDDAADSGLVFRYINGHDAEGGGRRMYEFTGGGVAVLDFDGDGWPDVYLAQGTSWPVDRSDTRHSDRLFRNVGGVRFEDVTESAGLAETGFGQGVAAGDIDGDGWPDLHVSNVGGNRLYLNNGDGTFHDATEAALLPGDGDASWSTSAAIADINGDGHADIYVVNYLSGPDLFTRVCRDGTGRVRMCQPFQFPEALDRVYLGRGDGTFRDGTAKSDFGVAGGFGVEGGKGLGVVAADLDADGRLELFVANDTRANFLFRVAEPGRGVCLVETGLLAGVGLSGDGRAEGSMGIAVGDADGDGRPDLFVTNFLDETNTLYAGIGRGRFSDRTRRAGLANSSRQTLGFGTQFLDADLDGDLDLLVANGHVDDYSDVGRPHKMATQYYRNRGNGRFDLLEDPALGSHFRQKILGRGLAVLDWNRDGRPDAVITALDVPTVLLTNTTGQAGGGLVIRLVATAGHRDAIGARVKLGAGAKVRWFELTSGDGYLASNQRCLVIGRGSDQGAVRVEVNWPGRTSEVFEGLTGDREWVLVEGRGEAVSLARPIERR